MYAPSVNDVSGQILAQGITGAAGSISDSITQAGALHKKLKAYRAMAVDGLGLDPEQVDKMSLGDLEGKFQAVALKSTVQQMMEKKSAFDANQRANAEVARRTQPVGIPSQGGFNVNDFMMAQNLAPAGRALDPSQFMQPAGPAQANVRMPAALTDQDLLGIYARAGALDPQMVDTFIRQRETNPDWDALKPHEFTTSTGTRGIYGKGGQFQFEPGQFMPGESPEGYTVVQGKSGPQYLRNVQPKTLPESYNSALRGTASNPGILDDIKTFTRQLGKTDDELKKLDPNTPPATVRKNYQQRLDAAKTELQNHLDSFREQGYADDTFWANEYKRYGLTPPSGTPAPSRDGGTAGGVTAKRVRVKGPNGEKGTIAEGDTLPEGWSLE